MVPDGRREGGIATEGLRSEMEEGCEERGDAAKIVCMLRGDAGDAGEGDRGAVAMESSLRIDDRGENEVVSRDEIGLDMILEGARIDVVGSGIVRAVGCDREWLLSYPRGGYWGICTGGGAGGVTG